MHRRWRKVVWEVAHHTPSFRGKERLAALLARPKRSDLVSVKRGGVRWELFGCDLNEFKVAVRISHSTHITEYIERSLKGNPQAVLWDVGANIGAISLPLVRKIPGLTAFLFEPSPDPAARLIGNVAMNLDFASRIHIMTIGLAEVDGLKDFFVSNERQNSGTGGLGQSPNRHAVPIKIQAYRGDTLVERGLCREPDVIKLDVEGFELEVLKGINCMLLRKTPKVVFEHSTYRLKEMGRSKDEVIHFMRSLGYQVLGLPDLVPISEKDLEDDNDFVAQLP